MKQFRVYLSGGMEYADGEGVNWRRDIQEWIVHNLEHTVFNPNVESNNFFAAKYPRLDFRQAKNENMILYQEIVRQLVEIDTREIAERTDYVICYWDEGAVKGAGTKGELTMARYFNKPVYLVTSFNLPDIPGWILGCTTEIFGSFKELKEFLIQKFL